VDANFTSILYGPEPHALLDHLCIAEYGAMDIEKWIKPRLDSLLSLWIPKVVVPLKDIWPELVWESTSDTDDRMSDSSQSESEAIIKTPSQRVLQSQMKCPQNTLLQEGNLWDLVKA
jgi:hypothetical protein